MTVAQKNLRRIMRDVIKDVLSTEAKPEVTYNETTTADTSFLEVVPPGGEYVYLIGLTGNVGTDGDVIEAQAYCTDGAWHEFLRLKLLANTSIIQGFANMKMDVFISLGTEYTVEVGNGTDPRFRLVSRGTGPWEGTLVYFMGL